ncbi:MAG: alpha/beta hydrolase [Pseudomonadales bacterium]
MTTVLPEDFQAYLNCLPPAWRARATAVPACPWWRWRDMDVHLVRGGSAAATVRLLVLHGAGGHAGALWPLAALAVDRGYQVVIPDLPGYGRSRVPDPGAVVYDHWVDCVTDLIRAEQGDGRPLVVLGASMGGLLGYSAAARAGGVAHLLATCLLDPSASRTWPALMRWGGAAGVRACRPLLRRLGPRAARLRLPLRWLVPMHTIANDPALRRLCVTDPRGGGGRMPLGFVRSFLFSQPTVAPEAFTSPPVSLVHPGTDRWTPPAMSLPFFERIAAPKRYVELPEGGHYPIEPAALTALADELEWVRDEVAAGVTPRAASRDACDPGNGGRSDAWGDGRPRSP